MSDRSFTLRMARPVRIPCPAVRTRTVEDPAVEQIRTLSAASRVRVRTCSTCGARDVPVLQTLRAGRPIQAWQYTTHLPPLRSGHACCFLDDSPAHLNCFTSLVTALGVISVVAGIAAILLVILLIALSIRNRRIDRDAVPGVLPTRHRSSNRKYDHS